jgi:hypothetical protein
VTGFWVEHEDIRLRIAFGGFTNENRFSHWELVRPIDPYDAGLYCSSLGAVHCIIPVFAALSLHSVLLSGHFRSD